MITPIYLAVKVFEAGLYTARGLATLYIFALGISFMVRYRQGKWKRMMVNVSCARISGKAMPN